MSDVLLSQPLGPVVSHASRGLRLSTPVTVGLGRTPTPRSKSPDPLGRVTVLPVPPTQRTLAIRPPSESGEGNET